MRESFVKGRIRAVLLGTAAVMVMFPGAVTAADTPARVDMTQPHPQDYPDAAQVNGEQGAVVLSVYVRPNGRVARYQIAQSSGFPDLDTAAVESVLNWRFVPATRDGGPISDWTRVRIVYQLPSLPAETTPPPPA